MKSQYLLLLCLAAFAVVSTAAVDTDNNPCRKISLFDSYLNTKAHFDLSALIDHGPIAVNTTDGLSWDLYTFSVCKALPTACPNTEPESTSVCGRPNVASVCQQFSQFTHGDQPNSIGSFCISSWNGTASFNIDGDGDRGVQVILSEGDTREELRYRTNVILSIKCDHAVTNINAGDLYVQPPFLGSSYYIINMRHKAGCPVSFDNTSPVPKGGLPGGILALISIGMLLIGLFGGGFIALWLNARYAWFSDPQRQPTAQYSQFELDDDI